jgi:citrate lyase subunit beta/citryl-CoA lyase
MPRSTEAGARGPDVRSDCWIRLTPDTDGTNEIDVRSKVDVLFGQSIRELIGSGLKRFGFEHARVEVEDGGALGFTIMARLEAAVKRLDSNVEVEFLPPMEEWATFDTEKDRFRRSRLYLPGNQPKFFINAGLHKPDGVILDLEDSVAPDQKDAARILVRNALRSVNFYGAERMVRINQLPLGLEDLKYVIPHNVHVILIPKCEDSRQVRDVDEAAKGILREHKIDTTVYLMPIIESALGAIRAYEIASASEHVCALAIGLEDYTADIGTERTNEGRESFWARCQVVNAARAAGVQPIDTVFSDVNDMEGLRESVLEAKSLGFEGKGCIHPRQITVVHEAMAPQEKELIKAKRIVTAFEEAEKKGLAAVALGSKMIDPPVVKRALHTIELAIATGLLDENWKDQERDA